ncbi:UBC-like protein [Stereum hirsutum FP-91666 SS1]|uniref:UBC-like protein n=1 Tax=Stereum hirsutum (strain FP-91666) TaxID=721885 RepID=UPI000440B529|nr:UBC-like protein [Stereum hirsutum FP-91666 SS1]EIM90449.1 UBC-like protein [Stereum hirsutum FP-91666 SS1]
MSVPATLNKNNSAVKRIMQEARELANDPSTEYSAAPLEEWHCTLRGPSETEFEGGLYHFRILLPADYPFRPPSLMMLTPNGRFETGTKICISFTNYHEELWQPAWGVRTAIIGLMGFFPLKGQAAAGVGSMESSSSDRKRLAALSRKWVCPSCNCTNEECLPDPPEKADSSTAEASTSVATTEPTPDGTVAPPDPTSAPSLVPAEPILAPEPPLASNITAPPPQLIAEPVATLTAKSKSPKSVSFSLPENATHDTSSSPSVAASMSNDSTRVTSMTSSGSQPSSAVPIPLQVSTRTTVIDAQGPSRPPFILDAAIALLLSVIVAILSKRLL